MIKICGVTSEADADMVAASGADALGLIFAESSRRVSRDVAQRISARHHTFRCVGVMRGLSDDVILEIVDEVGVNTVQLHDAVSEATLTRLRERSVDIWRAVPLSERGLTPTEIGYVSTLLIDGPAPGSGRTNDWTDVQLSALPVRVVIAGGLNPDNVAGLIEQLSPWGVDVASGVESSPGVKNPELVANFVSRAKVALGQKGAL